MPRSTSPRTIAARMPSPCLLPTVAYMAAAASALARLRLAGFFLRRPLFRRRQRRQHGRLAPQVAYLAHRALFVAILPVHPGILVGIRHHLAEGEQGLVALAVHHPARVLHHGAVFLALVGAEDLEAGRKLDPEEGVEDAAILVARL